MLSRLVVRLNGTCVARPTTARFETCDDSDLVRASQVRRVEARTSHHIFVTTTGRRSNVPPIMPIFASSRDWMMREDNVRPPEEAIAAKIS